MCDYCVVFFLLFLLYLNPNVYGLCLWKLISLNASCLTCSLFVDMLTCSPDCMSACACDCHVLTCCLVTVRQKTEDRLRERETVLLFYVPKLEPATLHASPPEGNC